MTYLKIGGFRTGLLLNFNETRLIDGVPCYPPHRWRGRSGVWPIHGRYQWYVCPKSGNLRRVKSETNAERRARYDPPAVERVQVWIGKFELCRKRPDGGWELLAMAPFPPPPANAPISPWQDTRDAATGRWIHRRAAVQLYGREMVSVAVRRLTAAEVKHLPIPIDLLRPPLAAPNVVR